MRQKILLRLLAFKMALMFYKDFYTESVKEIEDDTLYPQSNYSSCLERATDIIKNSLTRVINFYSLAIANHREETHNENYKEEIDTLQTDLTDSEQVSASRGWWMG